MEDNTKQPLTADASLYNGQPTDTGSSCPSARLTSCTPSISKNKGGVSVENAPSENKQWFVLRVSYGRIIKAKAFVEAKGFECYVPMRYKEVKKHDKKRIITEPLFPSFLFVHVTAEQVETLIHDNKVVTNVIVEPCSATTLTTQSIVKTILIAIHRSQSKMKP